MLKYVFKISLSFENFWFVFIYVLLTILRIRIESQHQENLFDLYQHPSIFKVPLTINDSELS